MASLDPSLYAQKIANETDRGDARYSLVGLQNVGNNTYRDLDIPEPNGAVRAMQKLFVRCFAKPSMTFRPHPSSRNKRPFILGT